MSTPQVPDPSWAMWPSCSGQDGDAIGMALPRPHLEVSDAESMPPMPPEDLAESTAASWGSKVHAAAGRLGLPPGTHAARGQKCCEGAGDLRTRSVAHLAALKAS